MTEDLARQHRYDDGGPLAHRVEQGTFNPKVPGSRPGRPTFVSLWMPVWHWLIGLNLVAR